jgi:hypothetical protein
MLENLGLDTSTVGLITVAVLFIISVTILVLKNKGIIDNPKNTADKIDDLQVILNFTASLLKNNTDLDYKTISLINGVVHDSLEYIQSCIILEGSKMVSEEDVMTRAIEILTEMDIELSESDQKIMRGAIQVIYLFA